MVINRYYTSKLISFALLGASLLTTLTGCHGGTTSESNIEPSKEDFDNVRTTAEDVQQEEVAGEQAEQAVKTLSAVNFETLVNSVDETSVSEKDNLQVLVTGLAEYAVAKDEIGKNVDAGERMKYTECIEKVRKVFKTCSTSATLSETDRELIEEGAGYLLIIEQAIGTTATENTSTAQKAEETLEEQSKITPPKATATAQATTQATITSIKAVSNNGTALEIKNGTQTSVKVTIKDQNGNPLTDITNMTVTPATSGVVSITTNKDGTFTVRALKEGTVKVTFNYNNGEKTLTSALNFTVTDKTDKVSAPTSTISKEEKQKAETPTPSTPTISKEEIQKAETPAPVKTESNVSQTPVQVQIEESKKQEAVLTGIALSRTSMSLNKGFQGTFRITAYQSGVGDLNCNYSVSTSDNNVASVSISGNVVTVNAKSGGTCKVTVSARDKNGIVKSASCNVTVKVQEVSQPTQQSSQPVQQSSVPSQQSSTPSQSSVPNSNPDFFLGDSLEWIKALHDRGIPAGEEVKPYVEKHCRKIGSCNGQGIYELDASAQKEFMNALNKYRRSYGWEEAHWMQDKTTQDVKAFYEKIQRDWELVADTPEEAIAIYESAYGSFFDSNGNYSAEFAAKWTENGHGAYVDELSEMIKNNDFAHHGSSTVIYQSNGYDKYDMSQCIEALKTSPAHWEILMKQSRTEIYVAFTIDDSWGIRMMIC